MGIPQGTDRMRLGPTEALRAVFVAIGRVIMAADRPQDSAATDRSGRNGKAASRGRDRRAAAKAAPAGSPWRSLDETGNVRLLTAEDLDDGYIAASAAPIAPAATTTPAEAAPALTPPAPAATTTPAETVTAAAAAATTELAAADLPLPNYDTLSLASVRARLRTLDAGQLRVLVRYEQAHAERPEVLGMLERRIEKLETGG